jgi:HEAT repeat protein
MKKDSEWRRTDGSDLISATLCVLGRVGDRDAALAVLPYLKAPDGEYLSADFQQCIAGIGHYAVDDVVAAARKKIEAAEHDQSLVALVRAFGSIDDKRTAAFLLETLDSKAPDWIKSDAVRSLGKLRAEAATERISKAAVLASASVRYSAIEALKQIWQGNTNAVYRQLIAGNGDYRTQAAGIVLAKTGGHPEFAALKAMRQEGSAAFRETVLSSARTIVQRLMRNAHRNRWMEAWMAWQKSCRKGKAHAPEALPNLICLVDSCSDKTLRWQALEALGDMGRTYALPDYAMDAIRERMKDGDRYLRFSAAGVLGDLGCDEGLAMVTNYLARPKGREIEHIRIGARQAYARITGKIHSEMAQKVLAESRYHLSVFFPFIAKYPHLPAGDLLRKLAEKTAQDKTRKQAEQALKQLRPDAPARRAGQTAFPAGIRTFPGAGSRTDIRIAVDALENRVLDDETVRRVPGILEFLSKQDREKILLRLAAHKPSD